MITVLHSQLSNLAFIPHGHCYLWKPDLVWLHGLSDGLIALAYFSISIALVYFVRQRRDLPYPWIFQLFGAAIVACGLTHMLEIWTLWYPIYWVSGTLKAGTAIVSVTTAVALIPVIPKALSLPSCSELEAAKMKLEQQVYERTQLLRQSEERLQRTLEQYQNFVKNSPDIIERFDRQLRHLYTSPVLTEITGIESEAFLGKTCRDLGMNEAMVNAWEAAAARVLATGERQVMEFATPTLRGERLFEMAIAPEWSSEPETIESILCISRDITERKQTEIQLRDLTDRLKLAVQSAKMGIWDWDIASNRLTWDERIYELYGLPPEVASSYQAWESVIHPDDLAHCRAATQQAFAEKTEGSIEFRVVLPNGTLRYITSFFLIQRDAERQPQRMIGVNLDVSEQKRAEENLKQQQELLQGILDNIPVMLAFFDRNYQCQWVNRTWEQTLGWTLEAAGERDLLTEFYPDPAYRNDVINFIQTAETTWGDFKTQLRDGTILDTSWANVRLSDGSSIGIGQDITDRKRAEEARLQAEKLRLELNLLERILDGVLAGYWDWDVANHYIYMSRRLTQMFGYEEHELPNVPEALQNLMFAEDLPNVLACFDRHVETQGEILFYSEVRFHHKNGSTVWVMCTGQVIEWDAAGQPLRVVGCHVDITQLKQTEAQLRHLSDRLTLALQAGAIGTWDWDLIHEAIWDERMYEIYGLQQLGRTATYKDWTDRVHPNDLAATEAALRAAIRGESDFDVEFRIWRTDGQLCWVKAIATVQRDEAGNALRMTGINYDITEAKQTEAKILQTTAKLEASNRELEAFTYSVSHDLRAPLRAIDGFSKALLEDYGDQFDAEGQDYFERIRRNVQRMGTLIDDLLRLSRISRSEMQYTPVDLSALVQEQIKDLQASDPDRSVEFIVAPTAIVLADLTLMRVVITNLLENAWKFTSHHASARIEFGIIKQNGQLVYFVRDDGAGFDMAYAAKLFGVFQRLHNTDEFSGTGIGLATVQRAIHRHGGQVWAESMVEQGATIYFTIPGVPIEARV